MATDDVCPIRLTGTGPDYWLRPPDAPVAAESMRTALAARLLADGAADEEVAIHFVGNVGLDEIFAGHRPPASSIGWEGLILPQQERRTVRLPRDVTITPDVRDPGLPTLLGLRSYAPWILQTLQSRHLDLGESLAIRLDGELVGWIPVWRPSPGTSIIRLVVLAPHVHAAEERRLTHLRLAAYAHAIDLQCSLRRAVVSWLPDDGDPVNALKLSVASPARLTHWMHIRVRRDLATASSTVPVAPDVS